MELVGLFLTLHLAHLCLLAIIKSAAIAIHLILNVSGVIEAYIGTANSGATLREVSPRNKQDEVHLLSKGENIPEGLPTAGRSKQRLARAWIDG